MLPARIPKKAKRDSRWRSQSHRDWVRKFACCNCGSMAGIQVAHVRMGSGAGLSQKPDDFRCVPLCSECHNGDQHTKLGEPAFWQRYAKDHGQTVDQLMDELAKASPKAREIDQAKRERGL